MFLTVMKNILLVINLCFSALLVMAMFCSEKEELDKDTVAINVVTTIVFLLNAVLISVG